MNTNYKFAIVHIKKAYSEQLNNSPKNKYIVLYRAIKQCILNIELPHNWSMPPTRLLAEELKISRTTVNKSYELLKLEKLLHSKQGSGNRVNFDLSFKNMKKSKKAVKTNEDLYPSISEKGQSYAQNYTILNRMPNENLAFRPGLPPVDAFPVNQWKKLLNAYWRHVKSSNLNYSLGTGLIELKKSVANYLNVSRGVKCDYNQIVIVSGSLQSLYLIANTMINKGDSVVLENPLFPNVYSVFKSSQAHLIPVELDASGISIKALNKIEDQPKLVHVTPSNHYPSGVKMTLERRKALLKWASEKKALIIENDYENEIANAIEKLPSIFSLDKEDRTIYMGTFNRLLHPSIRLGYMIVPRYLTETVEALLEHSHRFVSPSIQVVMNQFIDKNYLYQHINNSIEIARERYDIFADEFKKTSKIMSLKDHECTSFHVIANFNQNMSVTEERQIVNELKNRNITTFSLSKCYVNAAKEKGLILGFSSVRSSAIRGKVRKMAGII
ncbi:MocR-like pyridoxine biosynthesis transcription factor PdxR [Psychroserpens sp. BH13MA-6]